MLLITMLSCSILSAMLNTSKNTIITIIAITLATSSPLAKYHWLIIVLELVPPHHQQTFWSQKTLKHMTTTNIWEHKYISSPPIPKNIYQDSRIWPPIPTINGSNVQNPQGEYPRGLQTSIWRYPPRSGTAKHTSQRANKVIQKTNRQSPSKQPDQSK